MENTETKPAKPATYLPPCPGAAANPRKTMNTPGQLELVPTRRAVATVTVAGPELASTVERLKAVGAIVLGFSVKGATYTLQVILPPGVALPGSLDAKL